jgi:leader peptidase (prepilin peptidase) / N-methyltransferase
MALSDFAEGYRALAQSRWAILFAFLFGAVVGSFLNVVIVRLPEGESIVRPRSRCPKCHDMIPWYLNLPILSWIALRGRCRSCKTPISIRYPTVELLTGTLFVAALSTFGPSLAALTAAIFAAGLVAITFIDIDVWEIPDEISIPGAIVGSILRPFAFDVPWFDGLLAAVLGASGLALLRWAHMLVRKLMTGEATEGLGLGDVKLIAYIGAFVGVRGLIPAILVASSVGSGIGLILIGARALTKGKTAPEPEKKAPEPEAPPAAKREGEDGADDEDEWEPHWTAVQFGPFLALGGLAQMFFGSLILRWFYRFVDRIVDRITG